MSGVLRSDLETLPELLAARGRELADERFVRDATVTWTYAEFAFRVTEIAAGLRARGVRAGDVVGVLLPNGPEYLEVWWATLWLGAVFNPVNPALTLREVVDIVGDSGARTIVCSADRVDDFGDADLPALQDVIGVRHGETDPLSDLRSDGTVDDHADIGPDDLMSLVYTSGTTGRPKGAMLSHRNFLSDTRMLAELVPAVRGDTLGMVLPLFHVNAQLVTTVMPLLMGANVAMWERFSASTFWETVREFEPVTFSAVPTMLAALFHAPGADQAEAGNSIRYVICGAAPLSPAMFRRFEEKFGIAVLEGYGLTEGACCSTLNSFYGPRKIGSIGVPVRNQRLEIRGPDGKELPRGEAGEVCVSGPNVMQGYYNRPDATAEALRDGWLHTGDVGYQDADNFVFLVDRVKDMIIRGGENIYPREIEDALLELDGVKECAVVGRPHEVRGEEVHAVVVLAEGLDLEAVQAHAGARLAKYKVPQSWDVIAEIPKTSTGKIDKKPLREALRGSVA
jgi:long-chain acyl-CoA synthetase